MEKQKRFISVRFKINALILGSIFLLTVSVIFISYFITQKGYLQIEVSQVKNDVSRVEKTILSDFSYLEVTLIDWAQWDDTYGYVQGNDPEYVEANLQDSTLVNLGLNTLIVSDIEGNLIYEKVMDLDEELEVLSTTIPQQIVSIDALTALEGGDKIVTGFVSLPEGLLMVAAASVLNNNADAPPAGTLIFGKFLDENKISELEELTNLSIDIYQYQNESLPPDVSEAQQILETGEPYVAQGQSADLVSGYSLIRDVNGDSIAVLKITEDRVVFRQANSTFMSSLPLIAGFIVLMGLVVHFLLGGFLVTRFTRLSNEVQEISESKDITKRVKVDRNDEIGRLATSINEMLSAVAEAHAVEARLQELEKEASKRLLKQVDEIKGINDVMVGRELKMIELKEKMKRLEEELKKKG